MSGGVPASDARVRRVEAEVEVGKWYRHRGPHGWRAKVHSLVAVEVAVEVAVVVVLRCVEVIRG